MKKVIAVLFIAFFIWVALQKFPKKQPHNAPTTSERKEPAAKE